MLPNGEASCLRLRQRGLPLSWENTQNRLAACLSHLRPLETASSSAMELMHGTVTACLSTRCLTTPRPQTRLSTTFSGHTGFCPCMAAVTVQLFGSSDHHNHLASIEAQCRHWWQTPREQWMSHLVKTHLAVLRWRATDSVGEGEAVSRGRNAGEAVSGHLGGVPGSARSDSWSGSGRYLGSCTIRQPVTALIL